MIDMDKVLALLQARDAERKAQAKPVDMFFAAARSSGRMSLEDSQKLNFAEAQKEYRKKAREAGPTFQDVFDRVGGRDHLKALQEVAKQKFDF